MKLNVAVKVPVPHTHEGARATRLNAEQELRRSVMACMLWEDSFYESGEDIAARIAALVPKVRPAFAAAVAAHARWQMKLRHVPLLVVREMARHPEHKALVGKLLPDVIGRPDEITEFLAIYWKDNPNQPLAAQVKKGLAQAFNKFDEHTFAKYDRDGAVKLRDALFLCHAKPADVQGISPRTKLERRMESKGGEVVQGQSLRPRTKQEHLFEAIVNRQLKTPDTWEVALSGGADKRATFERLMVERKLGALAFLRNLRNMEQAGVAKSTVAEYAAGLNIERILPFRFITAARVLPQWEDVLEPLMMKCLAAQPKLAGRTVLLLDVSGSMNDQLSAKSETTRMDAGLGLGVLLREICADVDIFTFSNSVVQVAPRRGFALRDAMKNSQPHSGTYLAQALDTLHQKKIAYDRIIVITDEQTADGIVSPNGKGYVINVASYKNGVGYGKWTHVDGWSEAIIDYIREVEGTPQEVFAAEAAN